MEINTEGQSFALLLPVTSRGTGGVEVRSLEAVECLLRGFVKSVRDTTVSSDLTSIMVYIGVDRGDPVLDNRCGRAAIDLVFSNSEIPFVLAFIDICESDSKQGAATGQVCHVWRELAQNAWNEGASFTILLGDDVRLLSCDWMSEIKREFRELHAAAAFQCHEGAETSQQHGGAAVPLLEGVGIPVGFGVVCFNDESSPGFPGFPVLHRTHRDIFPEIIPAVFVNQDADPFIFEVYLRFGAAKIMDSATLNNTVGGCKEDPASCRDPASARDDGPRYNKVPVDWKSTELEHGVRRVCQWLDSRRPLQSPAGNNSLAARRRFVTLDVLIPSFRVDEAVLTAICTLDVPEYMRTRFILILDKVPPGPKEDTTKLTLKLQAAARPSYCRVRQNKENVGAGPSRNHALNESCADWALFLDDDVEPRHDLLHAYGRAILEKTTDPLLLANRKNEWDGKDDKEAVTTCGFIGKTEFPPATTSLQRAVVVSDLTYMYDVSEVVDSPAWGVTANLLVRVGLPGGRRADVRFGDHFPKTGGGEDVDFCLRHAKNTGGKFISVPDAIVTHPWWPGDRSPTYRRFFGWSLGDGQLGQLHPRFSYRAFPNISESLVLSPLLPPIILGLVRLATTLGALGHLLQFPLGSSTTSDAVAAPTTWMELFLALAPAVVISPCLVMFSEVAFDIHRNLQPDRKEKRLPKLSALRCMGVAAEASFLITVLEFGRMRGMWARCGPRACVSSFGRKFEWFCGELHGAKEDEKGRACRKFVCHLVFVASGCCALWGHVRTAWWWEEFDVWHNILSNTYML